MAKTKTTYRCSACGYQVAKWLGRCPDCGEWGSVGEVASIAAASSGISAGKSPTLATVPGTPARPMTQIDATNAAAFSTGIGELDRVLGKGIVPGSVLLLAGEPGVGKSTLLLEAVKQWALQGRRALYVTGEESAGQVRLRAERTGAVHDEIYLAAESDLGAVLGHAEAVMPSLMIVDSVQTMVAQSVDGVNGGVTQIRAVTTALTSLAKNSGIAVVLVGHVTKDGTVAGPRSLEHLVDVVLSFEGDKHSTLRMVRGIKNRFGSADEVGCFEQREDGIHEVTDPSELFLHHRDIGVAGTAITVAMDGKRPLLGEVQALVSKSSLANPRRAVVGIDSARVAMILAVCAARANLPTFDQDVYVATVGGMKISEPAADLAVALALSSILAERSLPGSMVALGEIGLAGEVRRVAGVGRRVAEAKRLGFKHAIVPAGSLDLPSGIKITQVADLQTAMRVALKGPSSPYSF
ncbi:DNA repair protein RadA/Sms [Williamsia limnetica]|uniref:DNA repair protein RadA n=1 Tax=Williamsia limnetica TaxID=882452 RepID=A0A318RS19_WILLI|nr:DNA repair protein RadA [Williamsia limnetica]PYE20036.1 DNA repair protein RadA/Sms [Williamsia limnetica]